MPGALLFQVDAFTSDAFRGNPAAVLVCPSHLPWPDDAWLQAFAAEMNLSETAFLRRQGSGVFELRWFTPRLEVDLCGHATLAAAHALWCEGLDENNNSLCFHSRSGELYAQKCDGRIQLDFPAAPAHPVADPGNLLSSLGLDSCQFLARNEFDYLVEVATESDVGKIAPDFVQLEQTICRGVIITAASANPLKSHYVSRFFAPRAGINEDPVTGSAHCCLGPYWLPRLGPTTVARQISPRGGVLYVEVEEDRVRIAGNAVTIFRGELAISATISDAG